MSKIWTAALLALVFAAGAAPHANAEPGTLTMTGFADGTLNSTPFTDQPFTVVATFPWSPDLTSPPVATYLADLSVTLGATTYNSDPGTKFFAVLYQSPAFAGNYGVEVQSTSSINNLAEGFGTETWDAATQTFVLSDLALTSFSLPLTVPLDGGGSLVLTNVESLGSTATVFAPEPATLSLVGFGALATVLLRRRQKMV